jgi:hypothetical protein
MQMRVLCALLVMAVTSFAQEPPPPASLTQVRTVYLFPMAGGLDQLLASHLTQSGIFEVVTDPLRADAVFSDTVGETLETRLNDIYTAPPEAEGGTDATAKTSGAAVPTSTFRRGKGTVFLVSPRMRTVLWSAYLPPRNSTAQEIDKVASKIASMLKKDLRRK